MITTQSDNFSKTVRRIGELLAGEEYAIRGTSSLVLQGFSFNIDDVDILCSKATALLCNKLLVGDGVEMIEKVQFRKTPKFKSYFGTFKIDGVVVEIMGEWQIKTKSGWTPPFDVSERRQVNIDAQEVWVTSPESELKMYAAMGRWNVYHKLKSQIEILSLK